MENFPVLSRDFYGKNHNNFWKNYEKNFFKSHLRFLLSSFLNVRKSVFLNCSNFHNSCILNGTALRNIYKTPIKIRGMLKKNSSQKACLTFFLTFRSVQGRKCAVSRRGVKKNLKMVVFLTSRLTPRVQLVLLRTRQEYRFLLGFRE